MRIVASIKDVKWSLCGVIATMAFNVVTLPLMLLFINTEFMGIWYVYISIGGLSTLFDMGFAVTFSRMIAYACGGAKGLSRKEILVNENDEVDFDFTSKILKICRIIYFLISSAVFILLLLFGTTYVLFITRSIRNNVSIVVSWAIYLVAISLNIMFGYYTSLLRGTGNVSQANKNMVYGRIVQLVVLAATLFGGFGIIGGSLAYFTYTVVFRGLSLRYLKKLELYKKSHGSYKLAELKPLFLIIWNSAWKEGLIAISMYITNQASTLVCSLFLSLEETAAYSLGTQLAMMISQIAAVYFSSIQPTIQNAHARKETIVLKKNMAASYVFCTGIYLLLSVLLILIGIPVIKLINKEIVLPISITIYLLIYYYLIRIRDCSTSYFSCTNRIIYTKAYVISSLIAIVMMVLFADLFKMQALGIILGQFISQIVFNFWYWPYKCCSELQYYSLSEMVKVGCREIIGLCRRN